MKKKINLYKTDALSKNIQTAFYSSSKLFKALAEGIYIVHSVADHSFYKVTECKVEFYIFNTLKEGSCTNRIIIVGCSLAFLKAELL